MDESNESLLTKKMKLLAQAEVMTAELRSQVAILKGEPSQFENLVSANNPLAAELLGTSLTKAEEELAKSNHVLEGGGEKKIIDRNERGAVRKTIFNVLADGEARTVEDIVTQVIGTLPKATSRGSVKGALFSLKSSKQLAQAGRGQYKLEKGESTSATNTDAFDLKPTPHDNDGQTKEGG